MNTYFLNDPRGVAQNEYEHALYQIGTLGGGNHFMSCKKVMMVLCGL